MHGKHANSVSGSEQSSVLDPEPLPEPLPLPLPEPLPLPLLQSCGHDEPFSPIVVSHWPLPHEALPLPPLPQSAVQ
jgi:hypothetical protein